MIFAMGFGLGLGTVAGVSVGPFIFGRTATPKPYSSMLDVRADKDKDQEAPPLGTPVTAEMRSLLEYTEPWTVSPDYERVSMINRIMAVMWPKLTKAIMDQVIAGVRPALEQQVFQKFKFVEDIVLGTASMKDAGTWEAWVKDKDFTVGSKPPRVGGIKAYDTSDDEVVLEIPLVWGSNCKFNVGVFLRFGPLRLYVPVEVSNLQFKVEPRITIKPLVEHIPCVGGATVTLLKPPHVDMSLKIIHGVDLMALPGIKEAVKHVTAMVLNGMLIYPNTMSFPVMRNFGVPPPPKGCVRVTLLSGDVPKGADLYVKLETRDGRPRVSKTCNNSATPTWNQEFSLVVDDFVTEVSKDIFKPANLRVLVYEDDFGWNDTLVGIGELPFGTLPYGEVTITDPKVDAVAEALSELTIADYMKGKEELVSVDLERPTLSNIKSIAKVGTKAAGSLLRAVGVSGPGGDDGKVGRIHMKIQFHPFGKAQLDDDEDEDAPPKKPLPLRPPERVVQHDLTDDSKGVLTVHLIRCIDLVGEEPTTYVRLLVSDETAEHDDEQKSTTVFNENSPRWGSKFDFVRITAGSVLHLTVHNKASLTSNIISTVNIFSSKKKEEDRDKEIGKLAIPVKDVARNGFYKDVFTLQDTERGQVELALTWLGIVDEDD